MHPTGPSDQTNIGPNRVAYSDEVVFSPSGPKQRTISALVVNDTIALEADELVSVDLTVISPSSGVRLGVFSRTVVVITDDDRKSCA